MTLGNSINVTTKYCRDKQKLMVKLRNGTILMTNHEAKTRRQLKNYDTPSIQLVIKHTHNVTKEPPLKVGISSEDERNEFRLLANHIMEEYPQDEGEEETDDEDTVYASGPTFTYPSIGQISNKQPEDDLVIETTTGDPWIYLSKALTRGNQRVKVLFDTLDITPNKDTLTNFYYEHYEQSSERHHDWRCLDSLNTILGNDTFRAICLDDDWL